MSSSFIYGLKPLHARRERARVVTIGSFDGVHLGHQAVLQQVKALSNKHGMPSLALVFEPQPHEFFAPSHAPPRLMRLREKVLALLQQGMDSVLCLSFNSHLRSMTASAFIEQVLVNALSVKQLVVGDDFRFGCDRSGDFSLLQKQGQAYGFEVHDTQTLKRNEHRISSTRIRDLLEQGDLSSAATLLGRPYSISGRVIYGKQLGRQLGFPTLNIGLGRYRCPMSGVYAVRAQLESEGTEKECLEMITGVANLGLRPTIGGFSKPVLEAHLFDFNRDLYGQCVRVRFYKKIRDEKKFAGLDELKAQIHLDIDEAKRYFNE